MGGEVGDLPATFKEREKKRRRKKEYSMMANHIARYTKFPNASRAESNMQGGTCYATLHLLLEAEHQKRKRLSQPPQRGGRPLLSLVERRTAVTKGSHK